MPRADSSMKLEAKKLLFDVITFRNRLIHGYDAIDHQTVWETVRNDLPTLKAEAEQLLAEDQKEKSSHGGHGVHGVIDRYKALFCCLEWMKHGLKPTSSGRQLLKSPPCLGGLRARSAFRARRPNPGPVPQFAVLSPGL